MTSSHHGPYGQGYTRATMGYTEGNNTARWSKSHKVPHSSDWSLQLDSMKSELLVIANQNVAVNTFPGKEGDYHGVVCDWGEVVTR